MDGDVIDIVVDRRDLTGHVDLVAVGGRTRCRGGSSVAGRSSSPSRLRAHDDLPDDTRLWAALQAASGGRGRAASTMSTGSEIINAGLPAIDRQASVFRA
jgi:hypothetical protein